eukprot:NODE_778_length_4294_cov_0.265316.p2 type:complete len:176 gc:universal NODE_778_length_4294_cov_0.265316:1036-509(-)
MSSIIIPHLYDQVIQKTIKKVSSEFENHGVASSVIDELNSKWRSKLHQPTQFRESRQPNIQQQQNLNQRPKEEEEEDEYADHAQNFYNYQVDGQIEINMEQVDGDYHQQQQQYYIPANNVPIAPNPTLQMQSQRHDLSDSDSDEEDVRDKILCQFEKVNRSKNRWKTNFKDGKSF